MAIRPIFMSALDNNMYYKKILVNFEWFPGFSISQKQKSINSLHTSFLLNHEIEGNILEISTKSNNPLGNKLSSFNLAILNANGQKETVEEAYQKGKIFYDNFKVDDETDIRKIRNENRNHKIKGFTYNNIEFPNYPESLFYDWLYMLFLYNNPKYIFEITGNNYIAFSDIEFNPSKSISSQARASAIFVSLYKKGLIRDHTFFDRDNFIKFYTENVDRRLV